MDTSASQEDIDIVIRLLISHWHDKAQLATFAEERHGYGSEPYGVLYPGDLDEYDKEVEKYFIPEGQVELYIDAGFCSKSEHFMVSEKHYLQILAQALEKDGYAKESENIRHLALNCA
ncbi:hypothetical protein [Methylotenera sp. G11]|uniref:hypothetical protein n=1 Tax=Methylotenera sp. G11 TaxID=1506585 RepID=UPI00068BFB8E|nr:hypothetical protein [Methylotenera sp. G11]